MSQHTEALAIGWDAGGWSGRANAVALASVVDGEVRWGPVRGAELPAQVFELDAFVAHFLGEQAAAELRAAVDADVPVAVAIDAPLGYPRSFVQFVRDRTTGGGRTDRFIDHPLAFRDTDREIHRRFGKHPMSVSFDKLGNPGSVAMAHAQHWSDAFGLATAASAPPRSRALLEVYPALAKAGHRKSGALVGAFETHVGPLSLGDHRRDAALCAVMGLGYLLPAHPALPAMQVAPGDPTEGAIWFPAEGG